ncbi:hypothetical protein NUH88_06420 [Nisaea acidiphila]|uniref:Uncharacterized protein n=1 Tax=Nisaea acidiphila TaxID=1862145 RepID=A0A9J7B0W6_9PROT|nr:hypothetical protein [Nisaea acidiphila]UUX51325.1 hypothetical protein NUH88_06420 [Nisaea acidiphila]
MVDNNNTVEESERRQIVEIQITIESAIYRLKKLADAGSTAKCKEATDHLLVALKNPRLPRAFCNESRNAINALMQHAFMKATDLASKAAMEAAMQDDPESRAACIKLARENLRGAMKHKAPREFQLKCERMLETALLTGGVKAKGPTKAKPLDAAMENAGGEKDGRASETALMEHSAIAES